MFLFSDTEPEMYFYDHLRWFGKMRDVDGPFRLWQGDYDYFLKRTWKV